ncbi:MAG TPA: hypothetical protein PLZ55_05930 [bacterium]|nr:hypothetical protein [bacterium]
MRARILPIAILIYLILPNAAQAWVRHPFEDATVVERSELIVVAHLKEGSIEHIPRETPATATTIWGYRAVLVITEVLKGNCDKKKVPIIFHHGLTPAVGGYAKEDGHVLNLVAFVENYPADAIGIFDTGGAWSGSSLVKDARDDNLWFLRRRSGVYGENPGTGDYGIVDPEDLQPLELKEYFLMYLTDNPEPLVKNYVREQMRKASRGQRYLDHLEIQRILTIANPEERFDKLMPFFLNRTLWNLTSEARDGIISCGDIAGEKLMDLFDDPDYKKIRIDIIEIWQKVGYKEAIPTLLELLAKHDQFWSGQDLKKGWWNENPDSELTLRRREICLEDPETLYVLNALGAFQDPKARELLDKIYARWKSFDGEGGSILQACEYVLQELEK